ncbi:MAG: acyloxyacyl hydrolase [Bacteroidales bacterium]|nr:acyloxyacyl hydrolase [Bacteroidales bacterium]
MKRQIRLIWFLLIFSNLFSQTNSTYLYSFSFHRGFIFPHRPSLAYFINQHISEYNLECLKQLNDSSKWHLHYRFPYWGGGIYYSNLKNDLYTGKVYAIYSKVDISIWAKKKFMIHYSMATGLAYLTNHFNISDNYYNIAIGSSLNAYINFGIYYSHNIEKFRFSSGVSFTHYSNGSWKKPNLGFNIPALFINIGYHSSPPHVFNHQIKLKQNYKSFLQYDIMLSIGKRQNYPADPNHYIVNNLAFTLEKMVSNKRKWGLGMDIFYDPSIPIRHQEIPNFNQYTPYIRGGIRLSHDLILNQLSITFQTGSYVYDPFLPDGYIYSKVGLRYNINSWLRANLLLKSHFFKADVIEFGISTYHNLKNKNH